MHTQSAMFAHTQKINIYSSDMCCVLIKIKPPLFSMHTYIHPSHTLVIPDMQTSLTNTHTHTHTHTRTHAHTHTHKHTHTHWHTHTHTHTHWHARGHSDPIWGWCVIKSVTCSRPGAWLDSPLHTTLFTFK